MRAFGAELIDVSAEEGMEAARDLALAMQSQGQGLVLNQFANPDNPVGHFGSTGPEIWEAVGGPDYTFYFFNGNDWNDYGRFTFFKKPEAGNTNHWIAAHGWLANSRYTTVAASIFARNLFC